MQNRTRSPGLPPAPTAHRITPTQSVSCWVGSFFRLLLVKKSNSMRRPLSLADAPCATTILTLLRRQLPRTAIRTDGDISQGGFGHLDHDLVARTPLRVHVDIHG